MLAESLLRPSKSLNHRKLQDRETITNGWYEEAHPGVKHPHGCLRPLYNYDVKMVLICRQIQIPDMFLTCNNS